MDKINPDSIIGQVFKNRIFYSLNKIVQMKDKAGKNDGFRYYFNVKWGFSPYFKGYFL
jgi:hypothetical protein